jgi:hypothetical protein
VLKVQQGGQLEQANPELEQSQFLLQQLLSLQEIADLQERLEPLGPLNRYFPMEDFLLHLQVD